MDICKFIDDKCKNKSFNRIFLFCLHEMGKTNQMNL